MAHSSFDGKLVSKCIDYCRKLILVDPCPTPTIDRDWFLGPIVGIWIRRKRTGKWFSTK